jgi:hypothetical protein
VIMELMDGGCLADILSHHGELYLSETQIARITVDVWITIRGEGEGEGRGREALVVDCCG